MASGDNLSIYMIKIANFKKKETFGNQRGSSVIKAHTIFEEDPSVDPSTHTGQVTTACNSRDPTGSEDSGLLGHLYSCTHSHTHIHNLKTKHIFEIIFK